eukprot:114103_1
MVSLADLKEYVQELNSNNDQKIRIGRCKEKALIAKIVETHGVDVLKEKFPNIEYHGQESQSNNVSNVAAVAVNHNHNNNPETVSAVSLTVSVSGVYTLTDKPVKVERLNALVDKTKLHQIISNNKMEWERKSNDVVEEIKLRIAPHKCISSFKATKNKRQWMTNQFTTKTSLLETVAKQNKSDFLLLASDTNTTFEEQHNGNNVGAGLYIYSSMDPQTFDDGLKQIWNTWHNMISEKKNNLQRDLPQSKLQRGNKLAIKLQELNQRYFEKQDISEEEFKLKMKELTNCLMITTKVSDEPSASDTEMEMNALDD